MPCIHDLPFGAPYTTEEIHNNFPYSISCSIPILITEPYTTEVVVRSYSPGLHGSQISESFHVMAPLIQKHPRKNVILLFPLRSEEPDRSTVDSVLSLLFPEFTQDYADVNQQDWVTLSTCDENGFDQLSNMDNSLSSRPPLDPFPPIRIGGAFTSGTQPQHEHLLTVVMVRSLVE